MLRPAGYAWRSHHWFRRAKHGALRSLRDEGEARAQAMFFVYIIRSDSAPMQTYVGFTTDLAARLAKHTEGGCLHTAKFSPWRIEWHCAFPDKGKALAFEAYLKSHSGKAFSNKRLI